MERWQHKLKIKHLFYDVDGNSGAVARATAPIISKECLKLAQRDDDLLDAMEECALAFDDVAEADNPSEAFDEALGLLYDAGDYHRIWIG